MASQKSRWLLLLSCLMALVIHIGAIYWIKNLSWEVFHRKHAPFSKQETAIRNQQLFQVFKSTQHSPKSLESQTNNISQQAIEPAFNFSAHPQNGLFISSENPSSMDLGDALLKTVNWQKPLNNILTSVLHSQEKLFSAHSLDSKQNTFSPNSQSAYEELKENKKMDTRLSLAEPISRKIPSSEDFSIQIDYAPKKQSPGYLFRLTLTPKDDITFQRIPHHITFLIDGIHSSEHFSASKLAIAEALMTLQEGDSFNIFICDSQINRLSSENLYWNENNLSKAYHFLQKQPYKEFSSLTDFYACLEGMTPSAAIENGINTAILISNGETSLSLEKQREVITLWTQKNGGKMSFYSVISDDRGNLPLFDLFSSVNKGSLTCVARDENVSTLLLNLMHNLQNPIAKDMITSWTAPDGNEITLFPTGNRSPNLYQQTPYVIYGNINRLEDFQIMFQGKHDDRSIDIKQVVSFHDAQKSDEYLLERALVLQQAYDEYDRYLRSGDQFHLQQARQLLMIYQIPIPF